MYFRSMIQVESPTKTCTDFGTQGVQALATSDRPGKWESEKVHGHNARLVLKTSENGWQRGAIMRLRGNAYALRLPF